VDAVYSKTYRFDLWRGACDGILATGAQTFCLFIAIRYYDASEGVKSAIASAPFIGMFCSLLLVHYLSSGGWKKSTCGAIPSLITGAGLVTAAYVDSVELFALCVVAAYLSRSALIPFVTSIYKDNYPHTKRGVSISKPLMTTVGVSAFFGFGGSLILEADIGYFRWLLLILGIAGFVKAWAVYSMPSQPIERSSHKNPFGNLKYLFLDPSFGYVLLTWFIMGFANLWTLPLKVDYVASAKYGIEASAFIVALITTIIPDTFRFLFIPFWAKLFDRMNFIVLRIVLNLTFALGIGLFFISKNLVVIGIGSALIGFSFSGGYIAWSLWVTRYAPPGKTAAYMSVHVFLTGVRGTLGPILGYWTAAKIGTVNIGILSSAMMVFASLMLIPEIKKIRVSET